MNSPSGSDHSPLNPPFKDLAPGLAVGGDRFLLKKILGQSGFGIVWLAHDKRLREPVALKFIPPQIISDPATREDLRREILRTRKLSHPHIVRTYDLHEEPGHTPFISMEYVDGPNLHLLRCHRPTLVLPWKVLGPLARHLCAALDYAHGENVVHKDLKPANLMLNSQERLKVSDFGLAHVIHNSWTRATSQTLPGGTFHFMSPHQAIGRKPQLSDDIYSLGATLYDLLTSTPPFHSGDVSYQIQHTIPDPMPQRLLDLALENDIPSEVAALVMACLAKDPEQRPPSAAAILEWLDAAEKRPTSAPAPMPASTNSSNAPPPSPNASEQHSTPTQQPPDEDSIPTPPKSALEPNSMETQPPAESKASTERWPWWIIPFAAAFLLISWAGVFVWSLFQSQSRDPSNIENIVLLRTNTPIATPGAAPIENPKPEPIPSLQLEQVLPGHDSTVNTLAFSPNRRWLASGSEDGMVGVYDLREGSLGWTHTVSVGPIASVAISADSLWLATGCTDQTVRLWHLGNGEAGPIFTGFHGPVMSVAFSPSGKYLACGDSEGSLSLLDYETPKRVRELARYGGPVMALAFAQDGLRLFSGGQAQRICCWEVPTGKVVHEFSGHTARINSVALSYDGQTMASCSEDRTVRLWDLPSQSLKHTFRLKKNLATGLSFSPDSATLAGATSFGWILFWDMPTLRENIFSKYQSPLRTVSFSPDGSALAMGGKDGLLRILPMTQ